MDSSKNTPQETQLILISTESHMLSSQIPQKRPRPVKSCLICRNKKLKCDKEQPCSACIKSRRAEDCTYDERVGSLGRSFQYTEGSSTGGMTYTVMSVSPQNTSQSTTSQVPDGHITSSVSTPSASKQIHELQDRVRGLESLITQMDYNLKSRAPANDDDLSSPAEIVSLPKQIFGLHNTRSLMSLVGFPMITQIILKLNLPFAVS